ncbi:unnamed protein product [Paramecium sonneborni]|uniref:Uncharacterized protein n=1 Tax=Paramecium sonneborni TaxID=65129 RepID=A0A8S1R9E8_9CILI|nr:unnamed protein product [Paramecium sonneborni]
MFLKGGTLLYVSDCIQIIFYKVSLQLGILMLIRNLVCIRQ